MKKSCALLTHGGREAQRIGELSAGGTEIRVEATVAATRVIAQAALEGVEVAKTVSLRTRSYQWVASRQSWSAGSHHCRSS